MLTVAQTTENIWNFMVGNSSQQEISTSGDYPGDIRL